MKKEKVVKDFFNNNPEFLDTLQKGQFGCPEQWLEDVDIPSITNDLNLKLDHIGKTYIEKCEAQRKTSRKRFIGVAISVALALTLFFTVTSPGQALAETMFRTVGQLFNGSLVILHDNSGQQIVEEESTDIGSGTFTSIEQAAAYANAPLVYINDDHVIIDQIIVQELEGITIILTYYNLNNGNSFILQQQIFDDYTARTASTPVEEGYSELCLFNDNTLYYTRTLEGNLVGIAEWSNTQIQITSDSMSENDFVSLFENLMST